MPNYLNRDCAAFFGNIMAPQLYLITPDNPNMEQFPRQLSSDKLPPPPQQVPSVGELYHANHADDPPPDEQ